MDLLSFIDIETLKQFLGEAMQNDIARWTFVFTVVFHLAWFKVRKEMRSANKNIVDAITGHTTSISDQGKRIENHELRIGVLESDVGKLKTIP